MSANHQAMLDSISLDAPWELIEAFSKFPRWKPADVNKSCDMMVKRMTALGIPVTVHEPSIYLSVPYAASVKAGRATFRAKTPAYSVSVPKGVKGKLVYVPAAYSKSVGTLFDRNQKGRKPADVRGKIAISEGFAFPHKMKEFQEQGAIGVIAINPGIDIHWGICTSIWGTPDLDDLPRKPAIPVVAVNNPDGMALIKLAKAGGAATLFTKLQEGWFKQKVPVVTIQGSAEPEKFVLVHGHYDSWDAGVGDNATGDATLLELARVLTQHKGALKRSVRIAWWPGHSTGRYAGSTWFADHFALDLDQNCVAQINCDSPGCRWATVFKDVSWMKEAEGFAQSAIKSVTGLDSHGERPHRAGDYAFNNIGITSMFMLSSTMPDELRAKKGYYAVGGCGGNIAWHTENDTLEIADKNILLRDMKVYLATVAGIADAEILPFDWRAQAREFNSTIANYQKAAGKLFDLSPSRDAAAALLKALEAFYADAAAGKIKPASANTVIQRLARILVPANYARVPRFSHDAAIPMPPLPAIAAAAEIAAMPKAVQGFAQVQLMRGQNRLIAALREAQAVAEAR